MEGTERPGLKMEISAYFTHAEIEGMNNAVKTGKAKSINDFIVKALESALRKDGVL